MCGGIGKKMWPLSREKTPKHFLPLFKGKSLFQLNYQLLLEKFRPEEIYIQTTPNQVKLALKQIPKIPLKNCFIEPETRDHGPAMGFMALKLLKIDPDEPFIIIQSDVLREPKEAVLKFIDLCEQIVQKDKKLITGGIKPDFLVAGVDYLMVRREPMIVNKMKIYQIKRWVFRKEVQEKKEILKNKFLLVHANHYCWTPRLLLESYRKYAPDWYSALQLIENKNFKNSKNIYKNMEKAPVERITEFALVDGFVIELPFNWYDFGTWESFFRYKEKQTKKLSEKNYLSIDSQNCYFLKNDKKFLATVGVKDIIIIDTEKGLLVCSRSESGKVGEVVEYLKKNNKKEYL